MHAVLIGYLLCLLAQGTTPPALTLQGRTVVSGSNAPVSYARIVAAKVGGPLSAYRTITADADGRFSLPDLAAGTYRIYAQHDGFLQTEYGQRPAGTTGVAVEITTGQAPPNIVIAMTRTGTIAGRVLERGEPARRAWVRALKPMYFDGVRSFTIAQYAETDDRGEYQLFGLAPGRYFVGAVLKSRPRIDGETIVVPSMPSIANGNRSQSTIPLTAENLTAAVFDRGASVAVFYPGASTAASANAVEVAPGSTKLGIDLAIVPTVAPAAGFHVRGRVDTQPASQETVRVFVSPTDGQTGSPVPELRVPAGPFDLGGVPPGRYNLGVQTLGQPIRMITQTIEVIDRDLSDVVVAIPPAVRVTGRVTVDGQPPTASDGLISVQLLGMPGTNAGYGAVRVQPDGTFAVDDVLPRDYRFRVLQGSGVPWVKSATFGGVDILNGPLRIDGDPAGRLMDIALSRNTAALDAIVLDARGQPLAGVLVVAVPAPARRDRSSAFRTATTDANGRARISALAPGDYTCFASDVIEANAWQDPDVLRAYESRGVRLAATEGGKHSVTLRITP